MFYFSYNDFADYMTIAKNNKKITQKKTNKITSEVALNVEECSLEYNLKKGENLKEECSLKKVESFVKKDNLKKENSLKRENSLKKECNLKDYAGNNKIRVIEKLKNKDDFVQFLNDFLNYNIPVREEIELCENKVVNSDKDDVENITYKIKLQEKYFFIKVIDKIDTNISYKIFEHSLKILNDWNEMDSKNIKRPIVIPIVIYVGCEEWDSFGILNYYSRSYNANKKNNLNRKIKFVKCKGNMINFAYNLIRMTDFEKVL